MQPDNDTIAAIATAPGRGGIGIVRLSGARAFAIAATISGIAAEKLQPRFAQYATFRSADGVAHGSVRRDSDPQAVATLLIATLEGGILLARAHRSPIYLQHAVDHLVQYVRRDVAA